MPPAARVSDTTTHGSPLAPGPGSVNVLIGNLPAWRAMIDQHACPMVSISGADGVGSVMMGSPTVLINNQMACRVGDIVIEKPGLAMGPANPIIMGEMTVIIGEVGMGSPVVVATAPALDYRKSGKGGTTAVAVDDHEKKVFIKTALEFCGPDATEDYAKAAKKQIEDTWSGKMRRNNQNYDVVVTVTTSVSKKCTGSKDADQIIVDKSTNRMNQSLYGAGPGHQTPAAATDVKRPRRIAHEYGHTLGLEDGYEDTPTGSKPKDPNKKNDIMSETWPDKDGVLPHPHQDHYDQILKSHGW